MPEGGQGTQLYVGRPRLIGLLDRATRRPLTLVSGPAGSGKTMLVSDWVARRTAEESIAWIDLDRGDEPAEAAWARVLERPRTSPLTVVLDAFEHAGEQPCDDLASLLRHSEPNLRVILLSRVEPALPLHRYRLADSLAEIGSADLAFTDEEAAELLARSGVRLSAAASSALNRRTRGWAAGLRLAAIDLARSEDPDTAVAGVRGDSGSIADYLLAEVLHDQPVEVRELLRRTSVVDVLQPGLIEELGGGSAGGTLAALARANAFVEPGERPGWYRFHPFLRELLQAELAHRSPGDQVWLHRRVAGWLARHGLLPDAVGHAAAVGAWSDAAGHAVDAGVVGELVLGGEAGGAAAVLRQMPEDVGDPASSAIRAALALAGGDMDRCAIELARAGDGPGFIGSGRRHSLELATGVVRAVHAWFADDQAALVGLAAGAEREVGADGPGLGSSRPELIGLALAGKGIALLRRGEIAEAREVLERAAGLAQAPGCEGLRADCLGQLALVACLSGRLRLARDLASRSLALAPGAGTSIVGRSPAARVGLAWVDAEQHELRAARVHVEAALGSDRVGSDLLGRDPVARVMLALVSSRLCRARGGIDGAVAAVDQAMELAATTPAWLVDQERTEAAMLRVARGEPEAALRIVEALPQPHAAETSLVLAAAYLELGDRSAVESALSALRRRTGTQDATRVSGRLLEAAHELRSGQRARARVALDHALRLASPESLRRPFREAPAVVRHLLETDTRLAEQHPWLAPAHSPGGRVTRMARNGSARPGVDRAERIIEPLTAKELEVLGHLSELLTTEEIAGAMFVSVNTVRTHVRSILRKLAVSRRNEAVRLARDLRLVAS
jgi:LuxR family maltose regulon positive regulatory protein